MSIDLRESHELDIEVKDWLLIAPSDEATPEVREVPLVHTVFLAL